MTGDGLELAALDLAATIAVTALVMFIVVLLGLTGSCSGGSELPEVVVQDH